MKRILSLLLLAAIAASSLLAVSCAQSGYENYTYKDGKIMSSDGKRSFVACPIGVQPYSVGSKCAEYNGSIDLFSVFDPDDSKLPVDEWMTTEYSGNMTVVYHRDDIELPDFADLDFSVCYICREEGSVISVAEIEDKALLDRLQELVANGEAGQNGFDAAIGQYSLKFRSDDFPALFFSLDLYIYEDAWYLCSAATNARADVTGLLDDYITLDAES